MNTETDKKIEYFVKCNCCNKFPCIKYKRAIAYSKIVGTIVEIKK